MTGGRGALVLGAVGCVVLVGCTSPSPSSGPTTAAVHYDLSRISQVSVALPPDFTPDPNPAVVRKVEPQWVDGVGAVVSHGRPFTVTPAECRPLLKPVDGRAGADTIGVRNDGPQNRGISLSATDPVTVPAPIPQKGCDRMTFAVQDDAVPTRGSAERIESPELEGATTLAVKITVDGFPDVEYSYTAILDDRVFVNVHARVERSFQAQPLLPDLLVQAVSALRAEGQSPPPTSTPASTAATSNPKVDLRRLNEIADAFPPGYPVSSSGGTHTIDSEGAAREGDLVAYGKPITTEPGACRALLEPVKVDGGADWASITSVTDPVEPTVAVTVSDPATPANLPDAGCDRFRFAVAGAVPDGTVQRLAAPSFDDAITYAIRVDSDVTNPRAAKPPLVDYFYCGILDGRTFVKLWARVPVDFAAEPALPELFARAVRALRNA